MSLSCYKKCIKELKKIHSHSAVLLSSEVMNPSQTVSSCRLHSEDLQCQLFIHLPSLSPPFTPPLFFNP
ncbi:hypothetical protein XELAEV_18015515mg [Xenopus laevis]|uniref:Uncharacterized protein n=1 Tax=Xenopus laevis TaxID=8355 RepID=A0A974DJS7_XENLA|nr:hypothetical protein XELAEV_18015515mg [Xenopus laevis]